MGWTEQHEQAEQRQRQARTMIREYFARRPEEQERLRRKRLELLEDQTPDVHFGTSGYKRWLCETGHFLKETFPHLNGEEREAVGEAFADWIDGSARWTHLGSQTIRPTTR